MQPVHNGVFTFLIPPSVCGQKTDWLQYVPDRHNLLLFECFLSERILVRTNLSGQPLKSIIEHLCALMHIEIFEVSSLMAVLKSSFELNKKPNSKNGEHNPFELIFSLKRLT